MKNMRGIIALIIAIVFGLLAARLVANYVKQAKVGPPSQPPVREPKQNTPQPPVQFGRDIPEGMRAVSIPVDEVTGVSRRVKRGDRVDIMVISSGPNDKDSRVTRLLLEAVEVLSSYPDIGIRGNSDSTLGVPSQKKNWVVTLLLSPENAATLTAADASGKLALAVRNPKDLESGNIRTAMIFSKEEGARPYLMKPQKMMDIRGLIKPGMRAFSLEARITDGAGGNIRPGDRVDVVITCPFGHFSTQGGHDVGVEGEITSTHMASRVFLQNVEVLAVSDQERLITAAPTPKPGDVDTASAVEPLPKKPVKETVKIVVLQVTPHEAETLTVATDTTSKSLVRLLLRNPDDGELVATKGQLLIELLTEKREYTAVQILKGTNEMTKKFFHYTKGGIATRSEAHRPPAAANEQKEVRP